MSSGDKSLSLSGQSKADILVVGGGIMGLWGAVKAAQAGLSVILVDAGEIGGGASGGVLGALFPWMPDRWDAKKQFQYDALVGLPEELAVLEAATGLSAAFRRSGRIIPLPKSHLKAIALRHQADALNNWHQGDIRFFWHVSDTPPVADYIAPEFGEGGYVNDTLAARAAPRAVTALLKAWLERQPNVRLIEHAALASLDAPKGRAEVAAFAPHPSPLPASGERGQWSADRATIPFAPLAGSRWRQPDEGQSSISTITFSHTFIAAGVDSFPMLENLLPPLAKPLGQGVKGQAAMLRSDIDPALPVAFLDGIYIVPHENGYVAVGSTSENHYADPLSTDQHLDHVLEKARALVPALARAEVVARWAGIRPKSIGRDPLVGPVADHPNVISLTGGFKISFGMAHRLGQCAVDFAMGREPEGLPENFTLSGQLSSIR
ncbi:FAD-binding oxidoreductase [Rhizobium sp. KVB221]|uniref:FAD-binding oxidoreductase n=1 Tax=Rhizobium setariae TaxID=2801340 RepID=A0A937CMJ9_9HYPH|nr:FAD-binding oxidoreductase [Rhizobium setariae]MBL0371019.1 FAD-binding oxidoreductase [Rhizobium setariae]